MKNTLKSFALLCMGLAIIGCVEDNLEPENGGSYKEGEIVFTATAAAEKVTTKTVYGDPADSNNDGKNDFIPVMWEHGDRIQIVCPQSAEVQSVEYSIGTSGEAANSEAATIAKIGDIGLRWSDETTHYFYAMYPSPASTEKNDAIEYVNGVAIMTGSIPSIQKESRVESKVYMPDMSHAYMYAFGSGTQDNPNVKLEFSPLFTTLQFDISISEIGDVTPDKQIWLKSVSLVSAGNKVICGDFKYTFGANAKENTIEYIEGTGSNEVSIEFENFIALAPTEECSVTFFVLPTCSWTEGENDLQLKVEYMNANKFYTKTATIKAAIPSNKKTHFKNVTLPRFEDVDGSSWIESLDPDAPLGGLSVPAAGNAFTSYYSSSSTNAKYYREQTKDLETLWKMGIRGFEFCTSVGSNRGWFGSHRDQPTLEDEGFVCNGAELSGTISSTNQNLTFGNAFRYLESQLDIEGQKKEFIIVVATYKSYNGDSDGYDPQEYVDDLEQFIIDNTEISDRLFVPTATTTIEELYGKIVLIVRAADYEFIEMQGQEPPKTTNNKIILINNWGTSIDCWDRRYEGFARQKVFGQATDDNRYFEDYLYAIGSSSSKPFSPVSDESNFKTIPELTQNADGTKFSVSTGGTMYVQEWARVVPETYDNVPFYSNLSSGSSYLWFRWPESISEKKVAVSDMLTKSSNTTTDGMCINSLCGYYMTQSYPRSYYPYMSLDGYDLSNQGSGGDIAGLAADLNTYLYNEINTRMANGTLGAMGLVMMNYIGASEADFSNNAENHTASPADAADASAQLPGLIIMNNFR